MFVVVGATGNTGSMVVATLLHRKQPVRIVARSAEKGAGWKAKGAEVAVASLDDVPALIKAFEGARGVYLMVPPNYGATAWLSDQQARMDRAAEAVKKSGVGHVVYLSSIGGQLPRGTGPIRAVHYGEGKLADAVRHLTILRPPYFMENWAPVIGAAKAQGVLPTFIAPQVKIPMISTKDIGRIGAEQLLADGQGRKIVEMAGPEEYSPAQVAEVLGHLLSKVVTVQHAPLSTVVPTFKSFGFSDEAAQLFEEMYTSFSTGAVGYETPDKLVRGTITLSEALRGMV
ncbi:MAG: NAD(P)H-binding protein [Nitrospira sp.]|nr:NAD(P)H-binding protein [Nitrospira sp.]